MERAFRAIRRSDVVALVIDAVDGITQQDFRCGLSVDQNPVPSGVSTSSVQCIAAQCLQLRV